MSNAFLNNPTPVTGPAAQAASLQNQARNVHAQMLRVASALQAFILPPGANVGAVQSCINLFGTNAAGVVLAARGYAGFLQTADGTTPTFPPTGWTFTPNSDGTITVAGTGTVPTT